MSTERILCYLPAERAFLCEQVFAAHGIPVIDLCCSDRSRVPQGAWVRTRSKRDIPGKGPVILAGGQHRSPIRGRETWLEVTKPRKVPKGFAGIIVRTRETGGWSSTDTLDVFLSDTEKIVPSTTILDSGLTPAQWHQYQEQGYAGLVLNDLLIGFEEFGLPPALMDLLLTIHEGELLHVEHHSVASRPFSTGLERLLKGEQWWKVCDGWLREDNPTEIIPPWGLAVQTALQTAHTHQTLNNFIESYSSLEQRQISSLDSDVPVTQSVTPVVEQSPTQTVPAEPVHLPRTILTPPERSPEPIAIVGLGCRLPKANSIPDLEQLLRDGRYAIQEVPTHRWDPELFWSEDRSAEDKTYSKIGGFVEDFTFNPKDFRIPPKMANQIDLVQQLALTSVADALTDAGYPKGDGIVHKDRVAVILGNSMGGESSDDHTVRTRIPEVIRAVKNGAAFPTLDEDTRTQLLSDIEQTKTDLPTINEDTMPGELANVIAGRIANAFDFNGPNFTVDAACASSMAAIQSAVDGLRNGTFDVAISGGADRSMGVPTYVKFSKIGALSANLSAPFDERADGFVMGEGCAILVLKRLSDAQRDGNRIYATIRAIGASSDGKGKGITAPNPKGQRLAIERAYEQAGINIDTVDYFECHGTSTQVGDKVEATVLADCTTGGTKKPRLGSIKSNIGHLKSAAGAAALVKTSLSIYHKTLYATANVEQPRSDIPLDKLHIQTTTEPWKCDGLRRAGVSAFGFGGTNFHVVLEENTQTDVKSGTAAILDLPPDITYFTVSEQTQILTAAKSLLNGEDVTSNASDAIHIAISSESSDELDRQLTRLIDTIERGRNLSLLAGRGIFVTDRSVQSYANTPHALLFTGQGSQYLQMGRELASRYATVRKTFEEAEAVFQEEVGTSLLAMIDGLSSMTVEEQQIQLQDTRIAQPATLTLDIAIARLLRDFGVEADMVAGHSLGEYAAAVVAGVMSFKDSIRAVSARGREMAAIQLEDPGKMASIACSEDVLRPFIEQSPHYVIAANKNCASQTVIAGSSAGVEFVLDACKQEGIRGQELSVSHAFHSNIVAPAGAPLKRVLKNLKLSVPHLPISTNVTGDWYPQTVDGIIEILGQQIASPVEWIKQIEGLYDHGARVFIECGPKRALTGLTSIILKDRDAVVLHTNHPKRGECASFHDALAQLLSLGLLTPPTQQTSQTATTDALKQEIADLRRLLNNQTSQTTPTIERRTIVCSGAALGLPGGNAVFSENNVDALLRGENRITPVSTATKNLLLMKEIVRVQKNADTGQGEFIPVNKLDDCIQLAGQAQQFDFVNEYDVDQKWAASLDITSKLAIAAGLETLRDAGIPLVKEHRTTRSGLEQFIGWRLPSSLQAGTGVIFASAFAGHTNFARHIENDGADETGHFDRRYLFQILAMGHAQFAQLIGAKGPNTAVNAACSSTTQAIAIAEDWIQLGRAKRVIIIAADDVTNRTMLEWIGSGFLAVGAATTESDITRAAKPFDQSRNGMILGMGAVGLMLECESDVLARGGRAIAKLMSSRISNSAYHGTRLDVDHIAQEMSSLVQEMSAQSQRSLEDISKETVFVSHETFTPARGGSAEAEIQGLRQSFKEHARNVVITNTKGFTGHAMGAGIEDVMAIKSLQTGIVPPIPHLENPDEHCRDLTFSTGETLNPRYAVRLAAGFGSQLALLAWERLDTPEDPNKYQQWLDSVCNGHTTLEVHGRRLHALVEPKLDETPNQETSERLIDETLPEPPSEVMSTLTTTPNQSATQVLHLLSEKTGYDMEELEPAYELEADLGIDTVKQAEIFSELRTLFNVPEEIEFEMTTAPTVQSLMDWFGQHGVHSESIPTPSIPAPDHRPQSSDSFNVAAQVLALLSEKTGYDVEELEPAYELEADLGIDTVKQAEIFSELRTLFNVPEEIEFEMTTAPTVQSLMDWFGQHETASTSIQTQEDIDPLKSLDNTLEDTVEMVAPELEDTVETTPHQEALIPHLFTTRWVPTPIVQESPIEHVGFRIIGQHQHNRQLTKVLESKGLSMQGDGHIVIDRSKSIEETFQYIKSNQGQSIKHWICLLEVPNPDHPLTHISLKGARSGLSKALAQEWPHCQSKVIWISPKLNSKELGSIILNELRSLDAVNEIYYDRNERYSLTLSKEAFSFAAHSGAPKTLVASGGARGVTAEVVKSFVKHGTRNVFLLGRTNPGTELVDIAQRKQDIKDRMTASGIQFTPAMVEKELDQVRKANDGFINMQEMIKLGATVQFVQCDVAQNQSVQSAFQAIEQQTDRIDLVIHGAGVEESKRLEDKDLAGFRRVYFPKVQGALNIINQISSHTFFLSMGSIAGRFGNEGQVDYAAANDAVAHLCQQRTNSLHISWSAWADVGMAVRGGMKHVLTERGIDLLPVDFCAKQTVALVEHRALGEVVITGALGNLRLPTSQPMLREIRITSKGLAGYTTLHPNTHKWLSDHAIGDTPVLPGVIGLELMAQTFQSVYHNQQIGGISNVQFHRPVKFHRDQPVDIEILVDILGTTAKCTLLSTRTLAGGRIQRTTHFEATMHISPAFQHKLLREEPLQEVTLSNEDVYKVFFHGPTFQVMDTGRSLGPKEILMDCIIDHQSTGPNNQTSPLTIESAFQTAGWLHYHNTKETVLPSAIQSIRIYQKATDWEGLIVRAQPVINQPYTYNIDVFQNHSIVMSLRGATFIATTIPPKGTKDFWTPEPDVYVASSQEDLQSIPQPDNDKLRSRGTLKRIQDRLAGRDAIYGVLKNLNIQDRVIQTDLGQPLLTEHSEMGISITHRNGVGWAALHTKGLVGIDVEGIELRTSQFMQDWFTKHERQLVGTCATKQTIVWSTKEALSKMLGVGFTVHPKEFEILEIHATTCIVSFGPNAQNLWSAIHNLSPLRCYWTQMDNEILSLVTVRTLKAKSIC